MQISISTSPQSDGLKFLNTFHLFYVLKVWHSIFNQFFVTSDDKYIFVGIIISFITRVAPTILYEFNRCLFNNDELLAQFLNLNNSRIIAV